MGGRPSLLCVEKDQERAWGDCAFCSKHIHLEEPPPLPIHYLRGWSGVEASRSRLRQPGDTVLVIDLGGRLAPFLRALEQTRADDNGILT